VADRISVMYAGTVCEAADAATIFRAPLHPYTRALLESMPRADRSYAAHRALPTIAGRIPNLADPPRGCRFHPRCPEADSDCRRLRPLPVAAAGHVVSCLKRGSPGVPV
jgi:oligopeptide/dipeptide ABC transporter ATP-binding protein